MKNMTIYRALPLVCSLLLTTYISRSQGCPCKSDPHDLGSTCGTGVQLLSINGVSCQGQIKVCGLTSTCGSGAIAYHVSLSSNELNSLTGFYWQITGGGGTECVGGAGQPYGQGYQDGGITAAEITATINWTSASTNTLEFFGYTGWDISTGLPTTLSYYANVQVTAVTPTAAPPAPTSIFMSSPVCSEKGWMYESSPCSSSATSWTWYGSAGGTFSICDAGPVLTAGEWPNEAYLCVSAGNACGNSPYYCAYVTVPNSVSPPCPKNGSTDVTAQTGNNANLTNSSFEIYPNPAGDRVLIKLATASNYDIQLISSNGTVIKRMLVQNTNSKEIPVSDLSNGLYFLIIKTDGNILIQKKILIMH